MANTKLMAYELQARDALKQAEAIEGPSLWHVLALKAIVYALLSIAVDIQEHAPKDSE